MISKQQCHRDGTEDLLASEASVLTDVWVQLPPMAPEEGKAIAVERQRKVGASQDSAPANGRAGQPDESATENRPPMARKGSGKGETEV